MKRKNCKLSFVFIENSFQMQINEEKEERKEEEVDVVQIGEEVLNF